MGLLTENGGLLDNSPPQKYYRDTPLMRSVWDQRLASWLTGAVGAAGDAYNAWEKPWNNPDPLMATLDTMALPAQAITAMGEGMAQGGREAYNASNAYYRTGDESYIPPITNFATDIVGMGGGAGLLSGPQAGSGLLGMNVWHGGPNGWLPEPGFPKGRPRLDKVGTGEGAQAYGHGFYAAEAKDVAKEYRKNLAPRSGYPNVNGVEMAGPGWFDKFKSFYGDGHTKAEASGAMWALKSGGGDIDSAIAAAKSRAVTRPEGEFGGILDILENSRKMDVSVAVPGHLKKLDLPDEDIAKYLDWDAPLSEQPESVRKILADNWMAHPDAHANQTGRQIYDSIANDEALKMGGGGVDLSVGRQAASEALRKAGIPGLKYYDGMSRGADGGTRNYVTWDQDVLNRTKILDQ